MVQENQYSDIKSKLVIEICSLMTWSVACVHRQQHCSDPSQSHFVDWYRVLGVEKNADIDAIRKRYHKLALQLHPDKNKHPKSDVAFKHVSEAYSCLSNNLRRREFDSERDRNFCSQCNKIPYTPSGYNNSLNKQCASQLNSSSSLRRTVQGIKNRMREEAKIMENCLKANSVGPKNEYPIFNPSKIQCRTRRESPVFNPGDYRLNGYPHVRNRVYNKTGESYLFKPHGGYDSPIFETKCVES